MVRGTSSDGGDVHHRDENPSNNSRENLYLMHHGCHTSNHMLGNTYTLGFRHSDESKELVRRAFIGVALSGEHATKISSGRQRHTAYRNTSLDSMTHAHTRELLAASGYIKFIRGVDAIRAFAQIRIEAIALGCVLLSSPGIEVI